MISSSVLSCSIKPRKLRKVVNSIRGLNALSAISLLDFMRYACVRPLKALIASALANAKNQYPSVNVARLYIETVCVDQSSDMHRKRWRPRAKGAAAHIRKGMSRVSLVLHEKARNSYCAEE